MSSTENIHGGTKAAYWPCGGAPGRSGFCDWVRIDFDGGTKYFAVRDPRFARAIEDAARECAEAIEARILDPPARSSEHTTRADGYSTEAP